MADSSKHPGSPTVTSLSELARDVQPARDLWSGIARQLPAAKQRGSAPRGLFNLRAPWIRVAIAASIAALLGVGIWIGHGLRVDDRATAGGSRTDATNNMLQAVQVKDPRYVRERAELLRSLPTQLESLPPESRDKVMASLATIHKAMRDIETALGRDTSNVLLQELLINTYQDEMRLLMVVHEASSAGKGI